MLEIKFLPLLSLYEGVNVIFRYLGFLALGVIVLMGVWVYSLWVYLFLQFIHIFLFDYQCYLCFLLEKYKINLVVM